MVRWCCAAAIPLILGLSACGFQLRGQVRLPEAMAYTEVVAPPGASALTTQLHQLLNGAGVQVVAADAAQARLEISEARFVRRVQSIGATARVREFALTYRLTFAVSTSAGEVLLAPQQLELTREYTFDQDQVLGAASEEEQLRQELVRTMARQVLRRIELASQR